MNDLKKIAFIFPQTLLFNFCTDLYSEAGAEIEVGERSGDGAC